MKRIVFATLVSVLLCVLPFALEATWVYLPGTLKTSAMGGCFHTAEALSGALGLIGIVGCAASAIVAAEERRL